MRTHLSKEPFEEINSTPYKPTEKWQPKPFGLWYQTDREWEEWCESEMSDWLHPWRAELEVDTSKILVIDNYFKFKAFEEEYIVEAYPATSYPMEHPDWKLVQSIYSGIEISPYRHESRMEKLWYYGWDVASGCIWDKSAVKLTKWVKREERELAIV